MADWLFDEPAMEGKLWDLRTKLRKKYYPTPDEIRARVRAEAGIDDTHSSQERPKRFDDDEYVPIINTMYEKDFPKFAGYFIKSRLKQGFRPISPSEGKRILKDSVDQRIKDANGPHEPTDSEYLDPAKFNTQYGTSDGVAWCHLTHPDSQDYEFLLAAMIRQDGKKGAYGGDYEDMYKGALRALYEEKKSAAATEAFTWVFE